VKPQPRGVRLAAGPVWIGTVEPGRITDPHRVLPPRRAARERAQFYTRRQIVVVNVANESVPKIAINNTISLFFTTAVTQYFANFEP